MLTLARDNAAQATGKTSAFTKLYPSKKAIYRARHKTIVGAKTVYCRMRWRRQQNCSPSLSLQNTDSSFQKTKIRLTPLLMH